MRARRRRRRGRRSTELAGAIGIDLRRRGVRDPRARKRAHGGGDPARSRSTRASTRASRVVVAGGGAGGLTIVAIARELGCAACSSRRTAARPRRLRGPARRHRRGVQPSAAVPTRDDFAFAAIERGLAELERQIDEFLARRGRRRGRRMQDYFVEARYPYQVWELEVAAAGGPLRGTGGRRALVAGVPRGPRARLRGQ